MKLKEMMETEVIHYSVYLLLFFYSINVSIVYYF